MPFPPFLDLVIILQLDAPSLSSFIRCSKQQHQAWSCNTRIRALWLWTHCCTSSESAIEQRRQQLALPAASRAEERTRQQREEMEARLCSNGPIFRALRSQDALLVNEVLLLRDEFRGDVRTELAVVQSELDAALHMAVVFSSVSCLQHLILTSFAGNLNVRLCGLTAAHCAALFNRPEHLRLLLQSPGIDGGLLSLNDNVSGSVLHIAASEGYLQCLQVCLEAPAAARVAINQTHYIDKGRTALHFAAGWDQAEAIRLLLSAPGIDVNAEDTQRHLGGEDRRTPLELAASYGRPASIAALLEAKDIDVNHVDGDGWPALYMAATSTWPRIAEGGIGTGMKNYAECVRLLLADPRVNIHFKIGDAPILNAGSMVHVGETALSAASGAQYYNKAAVALLVQAGVGGRVHRRPSLFPELMLMAMGLLSHLPELFYSHGRPFSGKWLLVEAVWVCGVAVSIGIKLWVIRNYVY